MSGVEHDSAADPRVVVVTGLGVVSPIGTAVEPFWRNALSGVIGTGEITSFDTRQFSTHRGGEVKNLDPRPYLRRLDRTKLPRSAQFAVVVTRMALRDAGLEDAGDGEEIGACFGTVLGNRPHLEGLAGDLFRARQAPLKDLPAALGQRPAIIAEAPAMNAGCAVRISSSPLPAPQATAPSPTPRTLSAPAGSRSWWPAARTTCRRRCS